MTVTKLIELWHVYRWKTTDDINYKRQMGWHMRGNGEQTAVGILLVVETLFPLFLNME